jgi:hypothetical protein
MITKIIIFFLLINFPVLADCNLEPYKSALSVIENEVNSSDFSRYFNGKLTAENIYISTYLMQFNSSNFLLNKDSNFNVKAIDKSKIYDFLFNEESNDKTSKIKNYLYCPELYSLSSKTDFSSLIFFSEIKEGMFFTEIRYYNQNYGTDPGDYDF